MPLENGDVALVVYVVFMIISLIISYVFGSTMIKKTGVFGVHTFIASALNFLLGFFAILGWFNFSWHINEFMFFGGLLLGIVMLFISELTLILVLIIKRKKMIQIYNANVKTNS
ncbi:hypothetical protein [Neobacillus massiliamazoniensis]|uniref:Uncharacterized protein n=1 Tax=Neobacillus massiliamazoniensis TaxID=1499688 RepID=A0A0U1NSP7_9BACI|nr:hypothetical protein [Neobacillus massiliamazoniensis]CRK80762.1 hypothetical protein BN000_00650 [Neobacillus massiliamazoniensis]